MTFSLILLPFLIIHICKERRKTMCSTPKMNTAETAEPEPEVIKTATQANAATQKANAENRIGSKGLASENIRTSNSGIEDDIVSSKKKLLGE